MSFAQASQWWERLQRSADIKGSLGNQVEPSAATVVVLEDLTAPEFLWNMRGRRWIAGNDEIATAGQAFYLNIANPADSNILAIVTYAVLYSASAQLLYMWSSNASFGAPLTRIMSTDTRAGLSISADVPTCQVFSGTSAVYPAGIPANAVEFFNTAVNPFYDVTRFILAPGAALYLVNGVANVRGSAIVSWEERALQNSER